MFVQAIALEQSANHANIPAWFYITPIRQAFPFPLLGQVWKRQRLRSWLDGMTIDLH